MCHLNKSPMKDQTRQRFFQAAKALILPPGFMDCYFAQHEEMFATYHMPRTQMTNDPCLDWKRPGWPSIIGVTRVPGIYIDFVFGKKSEHKSIFGTSKKHIFNRTRKNNIYLMETILQLLTGSSASPLCMSPFFSPMELRRFSIGRKPLNKIQLRV